MQPDELTAFLDCYAYPAAILSTGVIVYANLLFVQLRECFQERLITQLTRACELGHEHAQTALGGDEMIRWTLTHQFAGRNQLGSSRVVLLAQNMVQLPIPGQLYKLPGIDTSWIGQPRWKGISQGGGTMGELIRALDWAATPLGPIRSWSTTLIALVGIILVSPHPIAIYWGPQAVLLYNDGCIKIIGDAKHPAALGRPCKDSYPEAWHQAAPILDGALSGKPYFAEDVRFFFDKRRDDEGQEDLPEEVYLTISHLPVYEPNGTIGGEFHPNFDTSDKVIGERRMRAMRDLGTRLSSARTFDALWSVACEVLSHLEYDLPYLAAYSVQEVEGPGASQATTFILRDTVALLFPSPAAPGKIAIDDPRSPWPLAEMCEKKIPVYCNVDPTLLQGAPPRGYGSILPRKAAILPIFHGDDLTGCLVVLITPTLPFTPKFKTFLDVLCRQLSTSASMVASYEHAVHKSEELAALDRAKTMFFTNVSHELRTPLTLILGPIAEFRAFNNINAKQRDYIGIIERNAHRLLRLVNSVLDFAATDAGRMNTSFQSTDIGAYTEDLASAFRSAAESRGIQYKVTSRLPPDLLLWVDRLHFEKIFYNLLSNALKYTKNGSIAVSTYVEGTNFVLAVSDTGIGIPTSDLNAIFDKFHRVANQAGLSVEGTGIGLSLTTELVKIHGGSVTVESQIGVGSTFRVFIPLGRSHLPAKFIVEEGSTEWKHGLVAQYAEDMVEETTAQCEPGSGSTDDTSSDARASSGSDVIWRPLIFETHARARVLVCDDNADMRRYVTGLLAPHCEVHAVRDGQEGWDEMHKTNWDLVLSDAMMPRMTGFELLEHLRQDPAYNQIPFIILSARAGDDARLEGLSKGADDYLAKPFKAKELLIRVHTQLQKAVFMKKLETRVEERTKALIETRQSFELLCERLPVGVSRFKPSMPLQILWCNERWRHTMGLHNPEEVHNWQEKIHPDDRELALNDAINAFKDKRGFKEPHELRILTDDGIREITSHIQPLSEGSGETDWIGVISDITHLKKLERANVEAERQRSAEAAHNLHLQEQFIDITCHELRNPLNAIYNSADLISQSLARLMRVVQDLQSRLSHVGPAIAMVSAETWDSVYAELRDNLEGAQTIILCALHQKRIADDVLNVSKLTAGLLVLAKQEFDAYEEIKNAIRMFRDEINARGLQLRLEKDTSWSRMRVNRVVGDSGRFAQIVINLVSNAVKFTENASRRDILVTVGATPAPDSEDSETTETEPPITLDDPLLMCRTARLDPRSNKIRLHVAVRDSGYGMSEEEQGRLFQRFSQASPRTFGEFGGHGLGLYVSRMMAELQDGKINLHSIKGAGSVFHFFITVDRCHEKLLSLPTGFSVPNFASGYVSPMEELHASPLDMSPMSPQPPGKALRVLVVEDNMINQKIIIRLLKSLGCEVVACDDGADCVELLSSLPKPEPLAPAFDLCLMDLEMPKLDGLSATRKIRELERAGTLGATLPIVAVSGNARAEWAERAMGAGMNGFLRKPYSKAELQTLMQQYATSQPSDSFITI